MFLFYHLAFIVQLNQSDSLGFNQWMNLRVIISQIAERPPYLIVQLPRQIVVRCAPLLENGPEVDLDELPLRSMTEVTEYSTQKSQKSQKINQMRGRFEKKYVKNL